MSELLLIVGVLSRNFLKCDISIRLSNVLKCFKKGLCFCVGDATEKTAKQKGFHNTFSAGGNVRNLRELILQNLEKKTDKILYTIFSFATELEKCTIVNVIVNPQKIAQTIY